MTNTEMKIKCILGVVLLVFGLMNVSAQQKKALSNTEALYDFEENGKGWNTDHSDNFSPTDEKSASGSYSMKFSNYSEYKKSAYFSINTGHTIMKVRTAVKDSQKYLVAASYDGIVMGVSYGGNILWKNNLSGYMIHDIWCDDIDADGKDEVLVANADGTAYCLDGVTGETKWEYKRNDTPMYSVCTVTSNGSTYIVCGGMDLSISYLSNTGAMLKNIHSSTYSEEKPWGGVDAKYKFLHYANFLRPIKKQDGNEVLAVHGSNNHMQGKGSIYLFNAFEDTPYKIIKLSANTVLGDLKVSDLDKDGTEEIVMGTSAHYKSAEIVRVDIDATAEDLVRYTHTGMAFGYFVTQTEMIQEDNVGKYVSISGNHMFLLDTALDGSGKEELECFYAFNDLWKDGDKLILASVQSGGSCIHVLNTEISGWKTAYENISPEGKIQDIIDNTASARTNLASYSRPDYEREPVPVYMMTESIESGVAKQVADNIKANYNSPIFLGGDHTNKAEDWDRSGMENEKYKNKRDGRRQYTYTQEQCLGLITPWYDGEEGVAYWGGHGNDPYMFQLETTKKVIDHAAGKKTVLIYPELEDESEDFAWVIEDLFYPLAEYSKSKNTNIFVRTKHNFWQGNIYMPMWEKALDGDYAEIFVPSMEETTDKAMDISIAGRSGVWASGAVDSWGTRSVPDNPSFDRSRQHSHQRFPNHFLRHMMYHMASGAQYINNFPVYPEYMSFLWELVAKGALYVPKRNEILSYSPVHVSMQNPDTHYIEEGSSLKWSIFYDKEFEENNPFVFSRQNSTWMAAKVNPWDFSNYAGNVKDRRQNYLPNYPNGLVLITPPQEGVFSNQTATRGKLKDNLHPIYENMMTEYITDGRHYYSSDGTQTYAADTYYTTVKAEIESKSSLLPITVEGDVAWVVAQTSPTHLRLTIIDGGYLNPNDRIAKVTFNTINPTKVTDILDGKSFDANATTIEVDIPCGTFRFIDVELPSAL